MTPGRELEALAIAGSEQARLAALAAAPYRSHRVDDMLRRQLITLSDFRLPGRAAVERTTFVQQLRPRRSVDRAVHSPAAQQRRVRSVDDGVHRERHDIDLTGFQLHSHSLQTVSSNNAFPRNLRLVA